MTWQNILLSVLELHFLSAKISLPYLLQLYGGKKAKRTMFTAPSAPGMQTKIIIFLWSSVWIDSQAVLLRVSEEGKALLWLLKVAESLGNLQQRPLIYVDASKSSVPDLRSLSGFSGVNRKGFWHLWKYQWSHPEILISNRWDDFSLTADKGYTKNYSNAILVPVFQYLCTPVWITHCLMVWQGHPTWSVRVD